MSDIRRGQTVGRGWHEREVRDDCDGHWDAREQNKYCPGCGGTKHTTKLGKLHVKGWMFFTYTWEIKDLPE